jgi:hypothetical protein
MENTNKIAGYVLAGAIIFIALFSTVYGVMQAPSRLELAEQQYKEAAEQYTYWSDRKHKTRCDLTMVKIAEHQQLNLSADEVTRLSGIMGYCEGK